MILKIFTQTCCPNCPPAKVLGKKLTESAEVKEGKLKLEWYDTAEVEGMAEAAFYQVMATPTLLLVDEKGKLVGEWRGQAPKMAEVLEKLKK